MKVPTFSNSSLHFKSHIYLIILDFTGKFDVLTGHFFIEKIFDTLYNNSTLPGGAYGILFTTG